MNPLGRITAGRRPARAWVAGKANRRVPRLEVLEERRLMAGGVVQLVQFSGANLVPLTPDAGGDAVLKPQYSVAGPRMDPVCFIQNSVATVTSQITLSAPDNDAVPKIEVQETAPDGLDVKPTMATLAANKVTVDMPATALANAFPKGKISAYSPLTMTWQVSLDGGKTWQAAGTSMNPVYVTLAKPINDIDDTPNNYVTVAALSCINGNGAMTNDDAVPKIFGAFTGLNVKRVDGTALTYYGDYLTNNTTTAELLKTGFGQCGSFTGLFLDMLKIQGIQQANNYQTIKPNNGANGFLVKSWTFAAAGTSGNPNYPYLDYTTKANFRTAKGYQFTYAEVTRTPNAADQIKGQNNPDPAADFGNHQVAMYKDGAGKVTYYDPSYGTTFTSLDDFNNKAIAGFILYNPVFPVAGVGPVMAYLIKKNDTTVKNQLKAVQSTY